MKKLCAIGEALIDFIPNEKGKRLKDVTSFRQVPGGAPANVAASVSRLNGESILLTKLGEDAFGDRIIESLIDSGINTAYIKRSSTKDTSLAFVSLSDDGNRDFKFYRKTAADLDYSPNDIPVDVLDDCGVIHFCSVSLVDSPMKEAHKKLIEIANDKNILISFDPNLRLSLWEDHLALKKTVQEFLPVADIIKLSDEELEFITDCTSINEALPNLFEGKCKLVLYTKGKDGVSCYLRNGETIDVAGYKVDVVDTTGAGDSFIGAFLYKLLENNCFNLMEINLEKYTAFLKFANAYAAHTTTKEGALNALASLEEIELFIDKLNGKSI
ncbi:MAG: carbohydrate kinase [Anaerorhabdus sp.]|uniref:carbohydrate kinase family protein n=2 Tax=Anaerorhabdus sp. TaxID=1872524 RepID=UPI002FC6740A